MSLLKHRAVYKPFRYPWAYDAWLLQQRVHWLPEEVPMADDVKDWSSKLSDSEKNLLMHIFRFFTQSDIEVNNCYMKQYARIFGPTEVQMMLSAFSNMETIHVAAYAHLLDTLGIPEAEYEAFLKYDEMKDKYDYLQKYIEQGELNNERIAETLAIFGAFTEGLQLFASFAILLNFPRFNKMKGMGQIVTWSVRDETLHCESITKLFRTFISEHPEIWNDEFKAMLNSRCEEVVKMEDAFIDLAFEMGPMEGLSAEEVKEYIRFIANRRLLGLGLEGIFDVKSNPLPWMDEMLNGTEHANFFEQRSTEYSRAATQGTWEEAFASMDEKKPTTASA
jgi:ribonucleoside-diphosphate reductase beta chain